MNKCLRGVLFVLILLGLSSLYAEENYLNIDAKHFEADTSKNLLYFKGDVKMTKNKDILLCQSLVINTITTAENPEKPIPKDYEAKGDVSFVVHTANNILKGKGDIVYYYPNEKRYIIIGNGYLEDTKEGKKIIAEKIYIDELTGQTKIEGTKNKPIQFRLRLDEPTNTKEEKK